MANLNKLAFKVVFCTSEDPDFPASEISNHSPSSRGWLSSRNCEYPQEIVIEF